MSTAALGQRRSHRQSLREFIAGRLRFKCVGCGNCCRFRDGYNYVYLDMADRRRLAVFLGMTTAVFTRRYTEQTDGHRHLKIAGSQCPFLVERRCSVYAARPLQCRTWPFWPENLSEPVWNGEVAATCPGVGRGPRRQPEDIVHLLELQAYS